MLALLRTDGTDPAALSAAGVSALTVAESDELPMALPMCEETADLMQRASRFWSAVDHKVCPETFRNRVHALHIPILSTSHPISFTHSSAHVRVMDNTGSLC